MADELGSGDLLFGAMPKKFQILKKTRIGHIDPERPPLMCHAKLSEILWIRRLLS